MPETSKKELTPSCALLRTPARAGAAAAFAVATLAGIAPAPGRAGAVPLRLSRSAGQTADRQTSAPAGRVEEHSIASKRYRRDRRVWVYTPPRYAAGSGAGYDLLVVLDGAVYLSDIPLPAILDTLLAEGKAPPFVAVLIDNGSSTARLDDLANHARFAAFLGEEVLEWVRRRWTVTHDPRRTIVVGSSAGGLAAAYVAFQRPDLLGNVLSQSGAFWRGNEGSNDAPYEWLTSRYAASPRRDVRFLVEVGAMESRGAMGGAAPSILESNRRFRDALRTRGYNVEYAEVPGGVHAPSSWRERLAPAIAALAARK
jgi:enterochelin esterase-like enzyme